MPIYGYGCPDCGNEFELLRPVREASEPQPCPLCDGESPRQVATDFNPFTLRDGIARALPDRGKYWHLGKEVDSPVKTAAQPGDHPELVADKYGPPKPPSTEEIEEFEYRVERRLEEETEAIASGAPPIKDTYREQEAGQFMKRLRQTKSRREAAKKQAPNRKTTARTRTGKHGRSEPSSTSE